MADSKFSGFARLGPALKNSVAGLKSTYRFEAAFRQEVLALLCAFPLGLAVGSGLVEYLLLVGVVTLVLVAELLNSAIESLVDRVGLERHELSGRAKDQGSAAVLICVVFAILTWVLIFIF